LEHFSRLAASRTFWTAGTNRPINMAMMAMTTNNSIKVNPRRMGTTLQLIFVSLEMSVAYEDLAKSNGHAANDHPSV
jgi:hypothetical protein